MIYHWLGGDALASFARQRIFERTGIEVQTFEYYCLTTRENLGLSDRVMIEDLLQARYIANLNLIAEKLQKFWVVPRRGTVSVWSSQFSALLRQLKIKHVDRIERGILYAAETISSKLLAVCVDEAIASVINVPEQFIDYYPYIAPIHDQEIIPIDDYLKRGYWSLKKFHHDQQLLMTRTDLKKIYKHQQKQHDSLSAATIMMFATAQAKTARESIFHTQWIIDRQKNMKTLSQHFKAMDIAITVDQNYVRSSADNTRALVSTISQNSVATAPCAGATSALSTTAQLLIQQTRNAKIQGLGSGVILSDLLIEDFFQPWELAITHPARLASSLTILSESSRGIAEFHAESGIPALMGFLRTFSQNILYRKKKRFVGFHQPFFFTHGFAANEYTDPKKTQPGMKLILIGSRAINIGVGRTAREIDSSDKKSAQIDFKSVLRSDPAILARITAVIQQCVELRSENPIVCSQAVLAGGLGSAITNLLRQSELGIEIKNTEIWQGGQPLSPMAIWCDETGERLLIVVKAEKLALFKQVIQRECCSYFILGDLNTEKNCRVENIETEQVLVATDMSLFTALSASPISSVQKIKHQSHFLPNLQLPEITFAEIAERLLHLPAIADKRFIITALDRSAGGLIVRDALVGPWQLPVADCSIVAKNFVSEVGVATALGEKTLLGLINAPAMMRMAIAEAITNLASAQIPDFKQIEFLVSEANCNTLDGESACWLDGLTELTSFAKTLNISLKSHAHTETPVTRWRDQDGRKEMFAPLTAVISATATMPDVSAAVTPQLSLISNTELWLIALDLRQQRLGGSALAQVFQQLGNECPDVDEPVKLVNIWQFIQRLHQEKILLAYHDRSDGGLFVTLCEMAFAAQRGITITLPTELDPMVTLCHEEVGAVFQITTENKSRVLAVAAEYHLENNIQALGRLNPHSEMIIHWGEQEFYREKVSKLMRWWSELSYRVTQHNDNPACAEEEFILQGTESQPQIYIERDEQSHLSPQYIGVRPTIAIVREPGKEVDSALRAALMTVDLQIIDVTLNDLETGRINLAETQGLIFSGRNSDGDLLGAGRASAILWKQSSRARDNLQTFFARSDTFTLGIGNGAQILSHLKEWIPGAEHWPNFTRNTSCRMESRLVMVQIENSPALLLQDLKNQTLPVVVACREGNIVWPTLYNEQACLQQKLLAMSYVDNVGKPTVAYPYNPSGAVAGMTGFSSRDGRALIMLPAPDRSFLTRQLSWSPYTKGQRFTPWISLFEAARRLMQ